MMWDLALLALVALSGCVTINRTRDAETFDPADPTFSQTPMPIVEPVRFEPHAIPWDEINQGVPLPQPNRSILVNRPLIWREKAEVPQEEPKVQRDPLYPDDLRAYDEMRSRQQKVLMDPSRRNYQFGGYHIPYLAQNKTHQEVSQSETLAGRIYNPYTTGGQESNQALYNIKDPSVQVVRQNADHVLDDRSTFQTWPKKQHNEIVGVIQQQAVVQEAAINEPQEWVLPTKVRYHPKYLNPAKNQHGWETLEAKDNRGEIYDTLPMKKKRLLLFGDEGVATSQVTQIGGYLVDNNALTYPTTTRRREILPEVSNSGLFQQGTGRTFLDANRGIDTGNKSARNSGDYNRARPVLVDALWDIPYTFGRDATEWSPFTGQAVSTDDIRVRQPTGTWPAFTMMGEPRSSDDYAHAVDMPLHR